MPFSFIFFLCYLGGREAKIHKNKQTFPFVRFSISGFLISKWYFFQFLCEQSIWPQATSLTSATATYETTLFFIPVYIFHLQTIQRSETIVQPNSLFFILLFSLLFFYLPKDNTQKYNKIETDTLSNIKLLTPNFIPFLYISFLLHVSIILNFFNFHYSFFVWISLRTLLKNITG